MARRYPLGRDRLNVGLPLHYPWKGVPLITISRRQLDQVEYLIHQSIQGNHVLFDSERVRRAFWEKESPEAPGGNDPEAEPVETIIENLILEPTLERKRAFLDRLSVPEYNQVVRTYFNIIENNLFQSGKAVH